MKPLVILFCVMFWHNLFLATHPEYHLSEHAVRLVRERHAVVHREAVVSRHAVNGGVLTQLNLGRFCIA